MYGYLEGLPGGSDLEKLVKKYKKEIQSHRRISNSSNGADFRSMSVSQFVSDRSLVLYVYIVLLEFESQKLKFVRVHTFSVKAMKNRLEFIFNV